MYVTASIALYLRNFATRLFGEYHTTTLTSEILLTVGQGYVYVSSKRRNMQYDTYIQQGKSSRFAPHAQKVGLTHQVQDDDVVSSEL